MENYYTAFEELVNRKQREIFVDKVKVHFHTSKFDKFPISVGFRSTSNGDFLINRTERLWEVSFVHNSELKVVEFEDISLRELINLLGE